MQMLCILLPVISDVYEVNIHRNFVRFGVCIVKSQNHRMVGVGRDLCGSSSYLTHIPTEQNT